MLCVGAIAFRGGFLAFLYYAGFHYRRNVTFGIKSATGVRTKKSAETRIISLKQALRDYCRCHGWKDVIAFLFSRLMHVTQEPRHRYQPWLLLAAEVARRGYDIRNGRGDCPKTGRTAGERKVQQGVRRDERMFTRYKGGAIAVLCGGDLFFVFVSGLC